MRGIGPLQKSVIRWLQQHPDMNAHEIARLIFSRDPTENEWRTIHKSIAGLIKKGMVERSLYYHNGACYRVTDSARARPHRAKNPLVRVK